MSKEIDKQVMEIIRERMEKDGEISMNELMAIVEQHYIFDPHAARERELRKTANKLIAEFRARKNAMGR